MAHGLEYLHLSHATRLAWLPTINETTRHLDGITAPPLDPIPSLRRVGRAQVDIHLIELEGIFLTGTIGRHRLVAI